MTDNSLAYLQQVVMEKCWRDNFPNILQFCDHLILGDGKKQQPLSLYDFQKNALTLMADPNRDMYLASARRMGVDTMVSAFVLFYLIKHHRSRLLIVSNSSVSIHLLQSTIVDMFYSLPAELQIKLKIQNRDALTFSNGSAIYFSAISPNCGQTRRAITLHVAVLHNTNLYPAYESMEAWRSINPLLPPTGGKMIVTTSGLIPPGDHLCNKPLKQILRSPHYLNLPWYLHPHRDFDWEATNRTILGDKLFDSEYLT